MSFDVLAARPSLGEGSFEHLRTRHLLAVWNDLLPDGTVRVVVQASRPQFLGVGTMWCRGFTKNTRGGVRAMKFEDLYEFS